MCCKYGQELINDKDCFCIRMKVPGKLVVCFLSCQKKFRVKLYIILQFVSQLQQKQGNPAEETRFINPILHILWLYLLRNNDSLPSLQLVNSSGKCYKVHISYIQNVRMFSAPSRA